MSECVCVCINEHTVPMPPACGVVKERKRKKGTEELDKVSKTSTVVLTNTSAIREPNKCNL